MTPTEQRICEAFGRTEPCENIRKMARCFDEAGVPVPDDPEASVLGSDEVRRVAVLAQLRSYGVESRSPDIQNHTIGALIGMDRTSVATHTARALRKLGAAPELAEFVNG